VVFSATTPTTGRELFVSDGTAAGTVLLLDIRAGSIGGNPGPFVASGSFLYFAADDGVAGRELWRTDGTAAGTVLLRDVFPGIGGAQPSGLTDLGGVLLFAATELTNGTELWRTDGTPAGTTMVRDIAPGSLGSVPNRLARAGAFVMFAADDGSSGMEPWRSDGTAAGTTMVADLSAGPASTDVSHALGAGGLWFFRANAGSLGFEPWRSDGTAAGTFLLADVAPGAPDGMLDQPPARLGDGARVVFAADDTLSGAEAWTSDGTALGTFRIADLNPGAGSASPRGFATFGTRLVFAADDGASGHEPWVLPLAALGASLARPFGRGCPGTGGLVPAIGASGLPSAGNLAFAVTLRGARASSFAAMHLGASRIDLPAGGGCSLYTLPLLSLAIPTDGSGGATVPLPIPAGRGLAGLHLFFQFIVADPQGAFLGLATASDGLEVLVGT
jgi:ELWxxDGT repeat protein